MADRQKHNQKDKVLSIINDRNVRFVNLEFTDVVGLAKCVTIPVEQFPDCITHGKWFDGSAIEAFARVAESDMYLFPDLSTFAVLPGKVRPQSTLQVTGQAEPDSYDQDVVASVSGDSCT